MPYSVTPQTRPTSETRPSPFPALLTRYPNLHIADGAQRRDGLTLRGYLHLPVTC